MAKSKLYLSAEEGIRWKRAKGRLFGIGRLRPLDLGRRRGNRG